MYLSSYFDSKSVSWLINRTGGVAALCGAVDVSRDETRRCNSDISLTQANSEMHETLISPVKRRLNFQTQTPDWLIISFSRNVHLHSEIRVCTILMLSEW
jgi:hypothetical protein